MSLLDDILRMFGTTRTRVRWRMQQLKDAAQRKQRSVTQPSKTPAYEHQLCPSCGHPASKEEKVCTRCGSKLRGTAVGQASKALGWLIPEGLPVVTMVFLAACVGLYVISLKASYDASIDMSGTSPTTETLLRYGANHPAFTIWREQWWRVVTATFLHGSIGHIAMNAFAMWVAGNVIEERFGAARTAVMLFVTGVAGHALSVWWKLRYDAPPWGVSIGASTAGFGEIGFVLGYVLRHRGSGTAELRARFIPWAIYGLIMTFAFPNIDKMGHIGGMLAGLVLGVLVGDKRTARRMPGVVWNLAAVAALIVVVASFVYAAQFQLPEELR